jgi:hypothetical protein
MPAEDSLRYLRDSIALARLVDDVPGAVRDNFERLRKTYLYGLVQYELFTVADDDARLILEVAHPSGYHRLAPVDAARTLCRVAEHINKLWGADTPGGQTFPAPVVRLPRVAALSADGQRCVTFSSVSSVRTTRRLRTERSPSTSPRRWRSFGASVAQRCTSATAPAFNARACRAICSGVPGYLPISCLISPATKTLPSTIESSTSTDCSLSASMARPSTCPARRPTSLRQPRSRANGT